MKARDLATEALAGACAAMATALVMERLQLARRTARLAGRPEASPPRSGRLVESAAGYLFFRTAMSGVRRLARPG